MIVRRSYREFFFNLDGARGIVSPPSERPRGSNAVNALNRFSQNNDPEMNQRLETNARAGAVATMDIASRLVLKGQLSRFWSNSILMVSLFTIYYLKHLIFNVDHQSSLAACFVF